VSLSRVATDNSQVEDSWRTVVPAAIGAAAANAISGTLLAFAAPHPGRLVFGLILTAGAAVALLGLLVVGRVPVSGR
jgi:hypothetical protein